MRSHTHSFTRFFALWVSRFVAPSAVVLSAVVFMTLAASSAAQAQDKVVYHVDDAAMQATKGLRNIRNHLDVAPQTQIVVVTHAEGVDFLMDGARDKKNPDIDYPALVSALKARGVRFEICEITLRNRNLKKEQFNMDAEFTPSGVARIGQLQSRERYAYIKP
jgi:intracellular sulfur oxidation DsrE/DsrF family protein